MKRLLLVPAAGAGSRLGSPLPKLLVPVAGRAMIDRLLDLYAPFVERSVIVVSPRFAEAVERHLAGRAEPIELALQAQPTGMLDAILVPAPAVRASGADEVWITWCDQVAMRRATLERLAAEGEAHPEAAVVLPTMRRADPYIHLVRDAAGRIAEILHRREGDAMPAEGEGDMGLFRLSLAAYLELLPRFAATLDLGRGTGERNFLPFLAWLRGRGAVRSFPGHHWMESVGINTPEELRVVAEHLADAGG